MATSLHKVTVGRVEAGQGFLVTCSGCPRFRTIRLYRVAADLIALEHERSHAHPDPADQIPDPQPTDLATLLEQP